jgi:hypothetical protein
MAKWWINYPWRMIQTNMREIDMRGINADQLVRDLQSFKATVLLFNASGIIANYPTDLDYEPVNEFLRGDSTAEIIEKCHGAGIRIMARTDFSKVRYAVYEKHPDWAFRNAEGNIVNYNGDVHVCPNGPYQQKYMFRIIADMFARLPFDGIFYNMGGFQTRDYSYNYHGLCHCENCRRKFREHYGLDLPDREDQGNPVFRKYKVFQEESIRDLNERLTAHVRSISPDIAINHHDYQRIESNTEIGRPLPLWQYSASSNTRNSRDPASGIHPSNTSVDFLGFYYRHVAVSPWLQELRLWQNLANLGGLDYYLIGRLDNHGDKSGYENIRKVFRFAADHYEDLKDLNSAAQVVLFHKAHWDDDPEARGWIRALCELHVPLDEMQINKLTKPDQLKNYKLVILPDLRYIPDDKVSIFDEFARQGGVVLAAGEAALYTEKYEPRQVMPLQCMGIEKLVYHRKDVISAMLSVESPQDKKTFVRFGSTAYIAIGNEFIYTSMNDKAEHWLKMIPPQNFGPPERCYPVNTSDIPGLTRFSYGKGYGIYIPWKPGTFFYREGYSNTAWFMWDVLERLCKVNSLAPGLTPMVETTLAFRADRMVIQLVNMTGHFGNSYYPPLQVKDLSFRVPSGENIKKARTLCGGEVLPFKREGGFIEFTLPILNEYEAVILDKE